MRQRRKIHSRAAGFLCLSNGRVEWDSESIRYLVCRLWTHIINEKSPLRASQSDNVMKALLSTGFTVCGNNHHSFSFITADFSMWHGICFIQNRQSITFFVLSLVVFFLVRLLIYFLFCWCLRIDSCVTMPPRQCLHHSAVPSKPRRHLLRLSNNKRFSVADSSSFEPITLWVIIEAIVKSPNHPKNVSIANTCGTLNAMAEVNQMHADYSPQGHSSAH